MRFSLRTLMLMFTAIAVAYGCSWIFLRSKYEQQINLDSISREHKILQLKVALADIRVFRSQQIVRALNGELGSNDHWGQPYMAVALSESGQPIPNELKSDALGYYSLGQDGKSDTYGNDPDDLNSWRPSTEFYLQQAKRQASDRARKEALGIACVPLAMILGIVCLFRDSHLARKEEPQTA